MTTGQKYQAAKVVLAFKKRPNIASGEYSLPVSMTTSRWVTMMRIETGRQQRASIGKLS